MSDRLSFRILGPLVVERGETRLKVGGPKATALLGMLLMRPGEVVSTETLQDAVWGEVAPPTARTALQVQVSKLRKVLASDPSVELRTSGPGYVLDLDPQRLDAARFDDLREEGRAALARGDSAGAADLLEDALDLWRGAPLDGLVAPGLPTADLSALEERRSETQLLWAEAQLDLGRHLEALPGLERLRAEDPLDERVHVLSATALYRAGRQSEALASLSGLKRELSQQLGISPGPAIEVLERRILEHDPGLDAPAADEPPPSEPRESRKVVTALACRVGPGATNDPETERAALRDRIQMVRSVVEGHGGTVLDPMSGRVTALFGVPLAHEDDVVRAGRTAMELCERDPDLRVGVATDEVLVAGEGPAQRLRSAGPLDVADGLARAAQPGETLVAAETARLLRGRIGLESRGDEDGAARLIGDVALAEPRSGRNLVGRAEQLAVLRGVFDRVTRSGAGSMVTVIGPAGVGKSTLLERFLDDAGGAVAIGRCLPYGHDITYWPIAELIRGLAGILPEDPPEVARERIAASTAGREDGAFVAEQLHAILGLGGAAPVADDIFWAIRRFLEIAAAEPLVVVFDDIHWADATLLDLITYLATWTRDAPVLLVCLARPELLESRPAWGGGRLDAVNLPLAPLGPEEAGELLDRMVAGDELPGTVRARVLEVAEGNPLFLEELAAMLADDDLLRDERGRWVLAPGSAEVPIPPTIHALMASRLDRLPAPERRLLECAAVVGKEFTEEDLLAFEPQPPEGPHDLLVRLVEADLVVPDTRLPAHARAFRFRHILLRDAVYRATSKETRANDHATFAIEFELRTRGRLAEFEEILGYHLEAAWRYRRELGAPADAALADRAAGHLISAGRRAFMRTDNPAATSLLGRARHVLEADDSRQPELALLLAVTAFDAGEPDTALALIHEGLQVARALGNEAMDLRLRVEEIDIRSWLSSRAGNAQLASFAREAVEALTRLRDRAGAARAYRLLGDSLSFEGRWSDAAEAFREGHRLAIEVGDDREAAERSNNSAVLGPVPVAQCVEMGEDSLERTRGRNPDGVAALGLVYAMAGRDDDARRLADEAMAHAVELGDWREASVRMYSALALLVLDHPIEAEATIRPAVEALQRMGERNLLSSAAALLAESLYRLDRIEEAEVAARLSEEVTSPDDVAGQLGWRAALARILAARGELGEAERLGRSAVEVGAGADFPVFLGDAHMALASVLASAGRVGESAEAVRAALELYERKGVVPSARRAGEQLARLMET